MSEKISFESLTNTFFQEGVKCDFGCEQSELGNVWQQVTARAEHKSTFAVEDWVWLDIVMDGQQLAVIKANNVVRTSNRKFDLGDWVRTSPIYRFTDNCVCETLNSFYILVGEGTRKNSDESIFNFIG